MIELIRKHKVKSVLILAILAYISWYLVKDSNNQPVIVNLNEAARNIQEEKPTPYLQEEIKQDKVSEEIVLEESLTETIDKSLKEVPIYVCGAVVHPGVYYVEQTAIINDAIILSGGFAPEANEAYLNLAGPITAHQKIYVPKEGEEIDKSLDSYDNNSKEVVGQEEISSVKEQSNASVNINLASDAQLQTLPGIGSVKAKAIIDYRNRNSGFKTVDELLNVTGIGAKTFDKIKDSITI